MKRNDAESKLLARLIADERSLPQPERDWTALEAGFFARLEDPIEIPKKRIHPATYAAFAVAAGVAVALYFRPHTEPIPLLTEVPAATTETSPLNAIAGDALAPGSELRTTAEALRVEHSGRALWTLEPDSSARLRRDGELIVIELASGSVDAEVTPDQTPETFVVEAGDVRVAVHGTKFRVERRGESVDVSVREGVVSVSSPSAPAVKLVAPASKSFSASKPEPAPEPSHAHATAAPRRTGPLEPTIGDVEAGVSRIQSAAQGCFARHTAAKDGVQVSVRSTIVLSVRPDGKVTVQGFDPPLHPAVDACTRGAVSGVRFATSQRGIELTRVLELGR
ncbi:MAG TPA: FecR family protein [Polyangiaceae bacterium]|nr:FecR family protein [Polyangiaceae bacterium]